jgi:membrane-bound lytic murein transglycosylase MltF
VRFRAFFRALSAGVFLVLLPPATPLPAHQRSSAVEPQAPQKSPAKARKEKHTIPIPDSTWIGDFDGMRKRRLVRVLVVYNQTDYFIDKGTPRGITTDAFQMLEKDINRKYRTKKLPIRVILIPVRRDDLPRLLLSGKGDVAAAHLTVTPERLEKFDFSEPLIHDVSEIVVSGPESEPIATRDDLSGREVFVRESSIFHESLKTLNADFVQRGKAPVKLRFAPDELEDEDLLEMLNAGLVQYVLVNDYLARFWSRVLPKLELHPDITLREEAGIGWAMRKGSPLLKAELDRFLVKHPAGSTVRNMLFQKYLKHTKFVKDAAAQAERRKFETLVAFFRTYSDRYHMDYLLMAAQGYQESRLDQNAKSPVGAVGVMQLMPATGQDMGVGDITKMEPNIHAGVKYMRFMIDRYFADEPMDQLDKGLFAFAAYNCGPGRVQSLRREAAKKGYDPNKWFQNVEVIASQRIGHETVTYVANVYKYYIAYKLVEEAAAERKKAREEVKGGSQ